MAHALPAPCSLLLAVCVATGCVPPSSPTRDRTVFYASGADLQSINPLVAVHPLAKAVQKHVLFLTLAAYDSTLSPIPRLVRWEWNAGRTALTFRLRRDVAWHDGTPTTATDVVWTLTMARHPRVAYPRARDLAGVTAVIAGDSFTVRVEFERPQPTFPDVFTDLAILPAHRFDGVSPDAIRLAPFNRSPVGNGPFAFVEYHANQRWVFRRHEGFPAGLGRPDVERLVIAVVDEAATKLAALTSGELDFAGISAAHARFVRDNPSLQVIDYPFMFVQALVWNLRRPPFDDPRVRRALTMALDRRLIVEAFAYGFGTVAHGPVPPEHPWFTSVAEIPFDAAGARRLLREAGWRPGPDGVLVKAGTRFAVTLHTVTSGDLPLEQMIQAQLGQIGVAVTIRALELSTFLAVAQGGRRDYDALVIGLPGDLALGYVAALLEGDDAGPLVYAGYRSAEFDTALHAVRQAATEPALRDAWARAQRVVAQDHPITWLYHARGLQGASRRIQGAGPDLRGELSDITRWRIVPRGARRGS